MVPGVFGPNVRRSAQQGQVSRPSGTYAVQVKIADDALLEDNSRSIVITVRDTIPVLLVNGKASADRFERATEYLRLALNPFPAGLRIPRVSTLAPRRQPVAILRR